MTLVLTVQQAALVGLKNRKENKKIEGLFLRQRGQWLEEEVLTEEESLQESPKQTPNTQCLCVWCLPSAQRQWKLEENNSQPHSNTTITATTITISATTTTVLVYKSCLYCHYKQDLYTSTTTTSTFASTTTKGNRNTYSASLY